MEEDSKKYIGYLKYSGKSVEDGLLDARKSANALVGFDEILRFFLLKEDPSLSELDFEIPVRIKKGTWSALIPNTIADWILAGGGIATTAYVTSVATKAGKDGFLGTGPAKDIKKTFIASFKAVQWVVKIASHIGSLAKKKIEGAKIIQIDGQHFIRIPNEKGEYLEVPKKYFDYFNSCPEKLFEKNAQVIEEERTLEFGIFEDGKSQTVSVSKKYKYIFYTENDEKDEIVLPELKHGQNVVLEGEITRVTESANTIGFRYKDHTIVCRPLRGSHIANFKNTMISQEANHFFPKVRITGIVDRESKDGGFKEKRPQIFFSKVHSLEEKSNEQSLFN